MKVAIKSALSLAIVAAVAASSVQADHQQFVDDSSLNIHLRNHLKQTNLAPDGAGHILARQWAQAIRADFESGYYANIIGFDLSAHYAIKADNRRNINIAQDSEFADLSNPGLLQERADGRADSFGKAFGAIKINLADRGVLKYGRMVLNNPLINADDEDALPGTAEAIYADFGIGDARIYGAHVTRISDADQPGYDNFIDDNGRNEAVDLIGIDYRKEDMGVRIAYGRQDNVTQSFYADADYAMPINDMVSVSFGAQYGENGLVGAAARDAGPQYKDNIRWYGLKAGMGYGNLSLDLSMVDVGGATGDNQGFETADVGWQNRGGQNDIAFQGYTAALINDFSSANQQSVQARVGYDLSDMVAGLDVAALYVRSDIDRGAGAEAAVDINEYNLMVNYAVPMLEGLNISMVHGVSTVKPNQEIKTTIKDTRVMATYDLIAF